MRIRRVVIEMNMETMEFADMHLASGALEMLHELASKGVLEMSNELVRGQGVLRKRRSDFVDRKALQPQTQVVLDALISLGRPSTVNEVSEISGLASNSVRGQMHVLLERGHVSRTEGVRSGSIGRASTVWSAVERRNVEGKAPSSSDR